MLSVTVKIPNLDTSKFTTGWAKKVIEKRYKTKVHENNVAIIATSDRCPTPYIGYRWRGSYCPICTKDECECKANRWRVQVFEKGCDVYQREV